jgi:hypothetical protein
MIVIQIFLSGAAKDLSGKKIRDHLALFQNESNKQQLQKRRQQQPTTTTTATTSSTTTPPPPPQQQTTKAHLERLRIFSGSQ